MKKDEPRLENELNNWLKIKGKYVIELIEYFNKDDIDICFVMQKANSGNLQEYLKKRAEN